MFRDPERTVQAELVVEFTLICRWCGIQLQATDIERVWAHTNTDACICAGWRMVDGRATETWAEPTLWKDGDPSGREWEVPF